MSELLSSWRFYFRELWTEIYYINLNEAAKKFTFAELG